MSDVLIIEDDKEINALLCNILGDNNYTCNSEFSGSKALMTLKGKSFDLIFLDLMLPGISGEDLLKELRQFSSTPVIVISARNQTQVKVDMLRIGADDYITKPFENEEVLARAESALRRSMGFTALQIIVGPLVYNKGNGTCSLNGKPLALTVTEMEILRLLLENPKKLFTKANLFESVWHENYAYDDDTINTHISNLRHKLKKVCPDREFIETVWGIGYKLIEQ